MNDDLEYDPESGLWRPGRRTFIFMLGAAMAGTVLGPQGEVVAGPPEVEVFPGVGLFDCTKWLKQVYGQGWYLGRDGRRVYFAEKNAAARRGDARILDDRGRFVSRPSRSCCS